MPPIEAMAKAIRDSGVCGGSVEAGLDHEREHVFCDDPRLPADIRQEICDCRKGARAALLALAECKLPIEVLERGMAALEPDFRGVRAGPEIALCIMLRAIAKQGNPMPGASPIPTKNTDGQ